MFSVDVMLSLNVFHRVGPATEKDRIPAFVFTMGTYTNRKFVLYNLSCLCRREQICRLFR